MPLANLLYHDLTGPLVRGVGEGGFGRDPLYQFANLNGDWAGGDLSVRRNVWRYTEDVANATYSVSGTGTVKQTDTRTVNGLTLTRISTSNFYGKLFSNVGGLGLAPFVAGGRYLISCYVQSAAEQFMWQRPLVDGTSNGHGPKFLHPYLRRIWILAHALTTSTLTFVTTPTTTLGGESFQHPTWFFQGNTEGGVGEVYVGGFQIERVSSDSYIDGVALIGDSTMAGASAGKDASSTTAREVSTWASALLNVPFYNRAVGGNTTADMDARWATDITPIKTNCKYAVIQGGVNDFGQSRALADVQANVQSMASKAAADGLTPVFLTCTPGVSITGANETNRQAFNAWLKATFANVVDIAPVVADASNPSILASGYSIDGTHYNTNAKRQVGIAIAAAPFWSFTRPTPYQKVTAATYP